MAVGGDGVETVAVAWALTGLSFAWLCLRFYTRRVVIDSYGIDDHVYMAAFALQLISSCFIHVSAHYGIGRRMDQIHNVDDVTNAAFYGIMSQVFAATGVAVAKWSLGLFLLRIVEQKRNRLAIWVVLGFLTAATITWITMFWLQCTPYAYLYDRTIPGGSCDVPFMGISITHATACVFTDIAFAILPWLFLGKLQMNRREKLVTLGSLSLGIIAGAFGIIRATKLPALWSDNYLKNAVGIIIWTAAEMAVTIVCIAIPVCRPLYKRCFERWSAPASSIRSASPADRFRKHEGFLPGDAWAAPSHGHTASVGGGRLPLRTIGGSAISPVLGGAAGAPLTHPAPSGSSSGSSDDMETRKHGRLSRGGFYAAAGKVLTRDRGNSSDEETLAGDYAADDELGHEQQQQQPYSHGLHHHGRYHTRRREPPPPPRPSNTENQVPRGLGLLMGIRVTEEFHVTSNKDDV